MAWQPPTRDGAQRGRDARTGMAWAFEEPAEHWAGHDDAQAAYWQARSPHERLAQAAAYRVRVHGLTPEPSLWSWRFVPFGDEQMDEPRPASERFRRFCECLNRFDVEYVVVGSEAVAFHGAPRYSVDFDALVQPTPANLLRVIAALESFGLAERASAIDPELWARTGATLRVGDAPDQIDILLQLTGVTFDRIAAHAARGDYDGTPTRFIGLEELLVNKRAAGRPKDLADVAALERIKLE